MPIPARPQLGIGTLASTWLMDVDIAYPATASWVPVRGISGGSIPQVQVRTDTLQFLNGDRWDYNAKRGRAWSCSLTLTRKKIPAGTAYDQGQEFLRAAVDDDLGRVHVRWYKNDGIYNEAYDGIAVVDYQEQGGAAGDLDTVAVQLLGQGPRNTISHPALS
jgi:hypothetical protein